MFEMNIKLEKLPDSMCLDSNTDICSYKDGKDTVEILVRGYVTVDFKGERYCHFSDMPDELKELFKNGKAYDDERVSILENNWYEVFFNWDEDCDVAEIEGYTPEQLEEYCKECMGLFRGNNSKNNDAYTSCRIKYLDDNSELDVIIKASCEVGDDDDEIFLLWNE